MIAAAFNLILESLGQAPLDIEAHDFGPEEAHQDIIDVLCERAGIHVRQIKVSHLNNETAQGPLLLVQKADNKAMVLLNEAKGRMVLVDPSSKVREAVKSIADDRMHEMGYAFYRPLPREPLDLFALLRWCFAGTKPLVKQVLVTALFASFLSALLPIFVGLFFDKVLPFAWTTGLWYFLAAFVVVALLSFLAFFALQQGLMRLMHQRVHDAQAAVVDRLLLLSPKFFRKNDAGALAFRAFGVEEARQLLPDIALSQLLLSLFASVNFVLLFYYSYRMALWVMGAMLIYAAIVLGLFVVFQRASTKESQLGSNLAGLEFQMLSGISKIRAAGAEKRMFDRWRALSQHLPDDNARSLRIAKHISVINTSAELLVIGLILIAFRIHRAAPLSVGEFLAFLTATIFVSSAVFRLGKVTLQVLEAAPRLQRLQPLLEALPETRAEHNDPGRLTGRIELSHLSFRYEEGHKQVLYDVSLAIEPGDFVAIVGPSGSGKSTLLKLLIGFDAPSAGNIYFDGQDLQTLSIQKVRKQMGVVLQQGALFPGSLLDNIVGNSLLTLDDAWKAAKLCALDEDIKKLPMGMFTMIGEGGGALSGGQKQRILIARAIARNPAILLFDEATSALDNETQDVVTQSLNALKLTRIVIAHRLSTIKGANKICVLDEGRIVEMGGYDELLAKNGRFAELARRQIA